MQDAAPEDASRLEIEEEVRDFARRFARLAVSRAFREDGVAGDALPSRSGGGGSRSAGSTPTARGRDPLTLTTTEAELSLRGAQRLGSQLQEDADALRSRVLPSLRENARQLHALYIAIDRVADEILPEIDAGVKRMEKAVYELEEMRKEQVDIRGPQGSYGLGLALGAGLWASRARKNGVPVPEVFDTNEIFDVEEGGLAPL
ncbi:unnamed protein product [Laminaria digitata]